MSLHNQSSNLCVVNASEYEARVRFFLKSQLVWDSWLISKGRLSIPDIRKRMVDVLADTTDPCTHVTYTASTSLLVGSQQIVASMFAQAGALRFKLGQEARIHNNCMELINHSFSDVRFDLAFKSSPFSWSTIVPSGGREELNLNDIYMVVVVNDVTTEPFPLLDWCADVIINTVPIRGLEAPHLTGLSRHAVIERVSPY